MAIDGSDLAKRAERLGLEAEDTPYHPVSRIAATVLMSIPIAALAAGVYYVGSWGFGPIGGGAVSGIVAVAVIAAMVIGVWSWRRHHRR